MIQRHTILVNTGQALIGCIISSDIFLHAHNPINTNIENTLLPIIHLQLYHQLLLVFLKSMQSDTLDVKYM